LETDNQLCNADKELEYLIKSRYNLIYVVTWEERRVIDSLERICDLDAVNLQGVQVWDSSKGLTRYNGCVIPGGDKFKNPEQILEHITQLAEKNKTNKKEKEEIKGNRGPIFVLCDIFRYLEPDIRTPAFERKIRTLSQTLRSTTISVVMISPELQLPLSLEKVVTVMDYPLPNKENLTLLVETAKSKLVGWKKFSQQEVDSTPTENVVRALLGLTMTEAEDALAKAIIVKKCFDIPTLLELKKQIIRKGQVLDYIYSEEKMDDIGGLNAIKQWVRIRKKSFTEKAKDYGLPPPKGIFLLGVQGSGKSLSAKAIANELQMPLLKMEIGKLFGSLVGESEMKCRNSLKMAESIAPCVLLIDEIGKGLSNSPAHGDGGTTKRVISTILDWMQEKTAPVFIVACSNEIRELDPALLRRGRFDELFFVDLPTLEERKTIFTIHIKKNPRKRDPAKFDIPKLSSITDGFSGAEIEAVVLDAMHNAFADGREFTTEDIEKAIKICIPLSQVMQTELDSLREFAKNRMRRASDENVEHKTEEGSRFESLGN